MLLIILALFFDTRPLQASSSLSLSCFGHTLQVPSTLLNHPRLQDSALTKALFDPRYKPSVPETYLDPKAFRAFLVWVRKGSLPPRLAPLQQFLLADAASYWCIPALKSAVDLYPLEQELAETDLPDTLLLLTLADKYSEHERFEDLEITLERLLNPYLKGLFAYKLTNWPTTSPGDGFSPYVKADPALLKLQVTLKQHYKDPSAHPWGQAWHRFATTRGPLPSAYSNFLEKVLEAQPRLTPFLLFLAHLLDSPQQVAELSARMFRGEVAALDADTAALTAFIAALGGAPVKDWRLPPLPSSFLHPRTPLIHTMLDNKCCFLVDPLFSKKTRIETLLPFIDFRQMPCTRLRNFVRHLSRCGHTDLLITLVEEAHLPKALIRELFIQAAHYNLSELTAYLLVHAKGSIDIDALDDEGFSALHWHAAHGRDRELSQLIQTHANPNNANVLGISPLHTAAAEGHLPCMEVLLKAGADVHSRNAEGNSPLHLAIDSGHADAVRFLLRQGADPHQLNHAGVSPSQCALKRAYAPVVTILLRYSEAENKQA